MPQKTCLQVSVHSANLNTLRHRGRAFCTEETMPMGEGDSDPILNTLRYRGRAFLTEETMPRD